MLDTVLRKDAVMVDPAREALLKKLEVKSEAELYLEGKKLLEEKLEVLIRPSFSSAAMGNLQFYTMEPFVSLPGITPPEGFKHGKVLSEARYMDLLQRWRPALLELDNSLSEFWLPVLTSDAGTSAISRFIGTLMHVGGEFNSQYQGLDGYDQGIAISPEKAIANGKWPRAFVPELSWFSERIRQLEPKHILTLFPEAELDLYLLFVGRTLAGRSGSVPVGEEERLSHQYRKMCILYGKDAQTGKSTMVKLLVDAMRRCGYSVRPFSSIGARFNQADIVGSDFGYKDDTTQDAIRSTLESDMLKMLVAGQTQIACENKGKDSFLVTPMCTLLMITNSFDQSSLWKCDEGMLSRLQVLYTKNQQEIWSEKLKVPGVGTSPNIGTWTHLNWLANELSTTPEVLMMYIMRVATDRFVAECKANTLEDTINSYTDKLRFPISNNVLPNVVHAMLFAQTLLTNREPLPMSNKQTVYYVLRAYATLVADPNAHLLRTLTWQDFVEKGRPKLHPWRGIGLISKVSIKQMLSEAYASSANQNTQMSDVIKQSFGVLQTEDGINIGNSNYYIARAWAEHYAHRKAIADLANTIRHKHSLLPNTELMVQKIGDLPRLDYTESVGFDPRIMAATLEQLYQNAEGPIDLSEAFHKKLADS